MMFLILLALMAPPKQITCPIVDGVKFTVANPGENVTTLMCQEGAAEEPYFVVIPLSEYKFSSCASVVLERDGDHLHFAEKQTGECKVVAVSKCSRDAGYDSMRDPVNSRVPCEKP